jgi:hypothetical protein
VFPWPVTKVVKFCVGFIFMCSLSSTFGKYYFVPESRHINDPVLSLLKMEGLRLLYFSPVCNQITIPRFANLYRATAAAVCAIIHQY